MKRLIIGLIISFISPVATLAQKLTVIKATEQHWGGGVVGNHGINYVINLKTGVSKIKFDSVYVNSIGYAVTHEANSPCKMTVDSASQTYTIYIGEAYIAHPRTSLYDTVKEVKASPKLPVRHFKGKVLVVYHYKGKKKFFAVQEFTQLPTLNYP